MNNAALPARSVHEQGDFAGIVRAARSRPSPMLLLHAWAAPQDNLESPDGTVVGSLSASRLGAEPDLWSRDLGGIILNIRRLRGADHSVPPIFLRGVLNVTSTRPFSKPQLYSVCSLPWSKGRLNQACKALLKPSRANCNLQIKQFSTWWFSPGSLFYE